MIRKNNPVQQRCDDYTSNCVIWDGPNLILRCFNVGIVKGQTITPAIYESYQLLCKILNEINVEGLDLDCLADAAKESPSIRDIFDYIIEKLCKIKDKLDAHVTVEQEIIADLPFCFQYETSAGTVTKLEITEYYERIAAKICQILTELATIDAQFDPIAIDAELDDIANQITILCGSSNPTVTPTCTNDPVLNPTGDPVKIQTAYEWLEKAFCSFINFTGTRAELQAAFSYDCPNLGSLPKLNGTGNMADYYDWVNSPGNLAQSLNNLWITICDMRGALRYVLDNCCASLCSNLSVGYDLVVLPNDGGYDLQFGGGLTSIRSYPLYRNAGAITSIGPAFPTILYTFDDAGATFTPGALVGKKVRIVSGTGIFQSAPIVFNTATAITVNTLSTNWIAPVDGSSSYEIYEEYLGSGPAPAWVSDLYPSFGNVVLTFDDGATTYTVNTGFTILQILLSGSFLVDTATYLTGFNFSAPFKTVNVSFTYKHTIPIISATTTGTTITYTTSIDHPYQVGDIIDITGVNPVGFNLTGAIVTTIPNPNEFVVNNTFVGTYSNSGGVILQSMDCAWCECCCDYNVTNGIY